MKRPAFQFYPGDWQHDAALRSCSVAARGLWIEMMCVMHQAEPYGTLSLNGDAIDVQQLARMVGAGAKETARWLAELEAAGAFSRDANGRIYSRRMVRDERVRNVRAEAGKLGGNPDLLGRKDNHLSTSKDNHQVAHKDKVKPTPSSSSSSSTAASTSKARSKSEAGAFAPPDWVPTAAWNGYCEMRSRGKQPFTPRAKALAVGALFRLKTEGHDPEAVLDQSVLRGYTGLFPIKANGAGDRNPNRQESLEERNLRVAEAWTPPEDA